MDGDGPVVAFHGVFETGSETAEEAVHGRGEFVAGDGSVDLVEGETGFSLGGNARWEAAGEGGEGVGAVGVGEEKHHVFFDAGGEDLECWGGVGGVRVWWGGDGVGVMGDEVGEECSAGGEDEMGWVADWEVAAEEEGVEFGDCGEGLWGRVEEC